MYSVIVCFSKYIGRRNKVTEYIFVEFYAYINPTFLGTLYVKASCISWLTLNSFFPGTSLIKCMLKSLLIIRFGLEDMRVLLLESIVTISFADKDFKVLDQLLSNKFTMDKFDMVEFDFIVTLGSR